MISTRFQGTPMRSCPVCTDRSARMFFEMRSVPVREGYLAPTPAQAIACDLGDIILCCCRSCGHIWNDAFDPEKLAFDPQYDVSMFLSASYRAYIDQAIERLKSRYHLAGKRALEIACGKGDFLRALVAHGFEQPIGFDPTFDETSLSQEDRRHITAFRAYYDESHRSLEVSLVACRSALQYFREPRPFLSSIRRTLADQPQTILYFEVPNADETFVRQMVWNIAYEHGCFYSTASLARLFRESGFEVLDILSGLGGSQLEIEARIASSPSVSRFESPPNIADIASAVDAFATIRADRVNEWTARLKRESAAGHRVALWGAGARAISFLCSVPDLSAVQMAIDINPARQGRFLPKTGLPVVSPESLESSGVDLVIATNPNFAQEIRGHLADLGVCCDFDVLR